MGRCRVSCSFLGVNLLRQQWWAKFLPTISIVICVAVFLPVGAKAQPAIPQSVLETRGTEQVVLVEAPRWSATQGTLRAFEKRGSNWVEVIPTVQAKLGYGGLVPGNKRVQGTGKTPTGTYGLISAFGTKKNPNGKIPYTKVSKYDAWTYNPKVPSTYNIFQTAKKSWKGYGKYVERLNYFGVQYNYSLVLDFNLPKGTISTGTNGIKRTIEPADTRRGGGIFLHVTNGSKTAGCVAVRQSVMKEILQWLEPTLNPQMIIEVTS